MRVGGGGGRGALGSEVEEGEGGVSVKRWGVGVGGDEGAGAGGVLGEGPEGEEV